MKILIVEDDRKVGQFIEKGIAELSYTPVWVRTLADANDAFFEHDFDAVILDIGLPDGNGLDLLREWRRNGQNHPVIVLSARDGLKDRIDGLNIGADDYLPKPFSFDELIARLRSIMRRQSPRKETVLQHRTIEMDLLSREVSLDGETVELTNREFAMLELFLQNPNRVLTRTLIAEKVWEAYADLETNLIDVYVRRLRKKLETESTGPLFKTLRGTGYQLT